MQYSQPVYIIHKNAILPIVKELIDHWRHLFYVAIIIKTITVYILRCIRTIILSIHDRNDALT